MSAFKKKKLIRTKRICLRLKELRETKGMSLDEIAKKTKLDKKYLRAIEECRFDSLPTAKIYQKNFIKCYLKAIDVKPDKFIKQFTEEEIKQAELEHPKKTIRQNPLSNLPNILKFVGFASVIVLLVAYLGSQVKHIIQPPSLQIFSPQDGYITENNALLVHGKTGPEVSVFLNGQSINSNEDGEFKEFIDLTTGVNTIMISAEKKHGKTTNITRHVILRENQQFSLK